MAIISLCLVVTLVKLLFPRYVPVEIGDPPRQAVMTPFRMIDLSSARALGIATIALVATGDALLSVLFSTEPVLNSRSWAYALLILWIGGAETFYRLNRRIGIFADIDPGWFAKVLARHFWTLAGVEPGNQTEAYVKRILTSSQRLSMGIVSFGMISTGVILFSTSHLTRKTGMIPIFTPFVVVAAGQFCYCLVAAMQTALRISYQQTGTLSDYQLETTPRLFTEANAPGQSNWTQERAQKLAEVFINVVGVDEADRKEM